MWNSSSYTDTGQVRSINEDSVLDLNSQNLWMVADGMGGHSHGDYASQLVMRSLASYLSSPLVGINKQRLEQTLDKCNTQLIEKAERDRAGIIGCTVALMQGLHSSIRCAWSGDSRIYRLRNDKLKQLTCDHSQQCAVEDRDRLHYPKATMESSEMLTCAIGGDTELNLEQCWYQLCDGDTFLLCTDGLTKEVSDEEIRTTMLDCQDGELAISSLAQLYQVRGARDNVGMVWVSRSLE